MLTEAIVKTALESVLGYGFSRVLKTVFDDGPLGATDEEVLRKVLYAIRAHGYAIDNIEQRLAQVESAVKQVPRPVSGRNTPELPPPDQDAEGDYFLKTTGGRDAYFKRMRRSEK